MPLCPNCAVPMKFIGMDIDLEMYVCSDCGEEIEQFPDDFADMNMATSPAAAEDVWDGPTQDELDNVPEWLWGVE